MTLYLKTRPQTLEELDLESVRERLKKIVASGKIPHGLLFSGPRGTGKTTAARILAKVVNCKGNEKTLGEPCNRCRQCTSITDGTSLDVIELDAASHRGIDDIRALRDKVALAPSSSRKKVYIIDEAHMLTTEAANAFLKTLEEPPEHVMFILATTNPEKLPETIHSRLTNIVFTKASPAEIKRQLTRVARAENFKLANGVVQLIAKASDGSFRDAVKILEQLTLDSKRVSKVRCEEYLFQHGALQVEQLLELLAKKDAKACLAEIEKVVEQGTNMRNYVSGLIERLRSGLLAKEGFEKQDLEAFSKAEILALLALFSNAYVEIPNATIEQLPLEIAIVKWCQSQDKEQDRIYEEEEDGGEVLEVISEEAVSAENLDGNVWQRVLKTVKAKNSSIEALLRAARPMEFDGKNLKLGVFYKFHKERLEVSSNRRTLEDVVSAVVGVPIRICCILTQRSQSEKQETTLTETPDQDIIQAAKEIFGDAG